MITDKITMLQKLAAAIEANITITQELTLLPASVLVARPGHNRWSVAEVLSHLNTYNDYYLPAIIKALDSGSKDAATVYKSSWLGDYFVNMMQPRDGLVTKKFKAVARHQPINQNSGDVISKYLSGQKTLLDALQRAENLDIILNKISLSIAPIIKLRLGDVFRFLIAHQQRHFIQISVNISAVCNAPICQS